MPAPQPLPALPDLLSASAAGVVGSRDNRADTRRGAIYDHFGGAGALLFTREAARDRDLFRAAYLDTAEGDDLTILGQLRYGIARGLPSYGAGTALLTRASAAGGAGTVWQGSRILVFASAASTVARSYAVAADTPVTAGATATTVSVRATSAGPGSAVSLSGPAIARMDDPLWDASWQVAAIRCSDGTLLEPAAAFRARARTAQLAARQGYADAITSACVAQGATHIALLDSAFAGASGGPDGGLCHCYVADAGFQTSPKLLRACTAALDRYRVCGVDLQVLGMQRASVDVAAIVTLRNDPGRLPSPDVTLRDALAAAFSTTRYDYDPDELAGVLAAAAADVQSVTLLAPTAPATILVQGQMPGMLTRYELGVVTLQYTGPT